MSEEEKKEIIEEAGKRLIWALLDANRNIDNISSYARFVIRKQEDCSLYKKLPSKDIIIKYGLSVNDGYINYVWWILEQLEKGNIIIKEDVQPKS